MRHRSFLGRRMAAAGLLALAMALGAYPDLAAQSGLEDLVRTDSGGFNWRQYLGMTHSSLARTLVIFGESATALQEAETAEMLLDDAALCVGSVKDRDITPPKIALIV